MLSSSVRSAKTRASSAPRAAALLRFSWPGGRILAGALALTLSATPAPAAWVRVATHGTLGAGPGQFDHPYDIDVFDGRVYVADSHNNRVQILDLAGGVLGAFGRTGSGPGEFRRPRGLAVGRDAAGAGLVLVTDAKNDRIEFFDLDGVFLRMRGSIGDAPGQFFRPRGADLLEDGTHAVCDADNHRVKTYFPDGRRRAVFGQQGTAEGNFRGPFDLAISAQREVFVVDTFNARIQVFDLDGRFLRSFGGPGAEPGRFAGPRAIAIDAGGRVAVGEIGDEDHPLDRVQILDAHGVPLDAFGRRGDGPDGLRFVTGLAFDAAGRLWVAESEHPWVSVWAEADVPVRRARFGSVKGAFGGR